MFVYFLILIFTCNDMPGIGIAGPGPDGPGCGIFIGCAPIIPACGIPAGTIGPIGPIYKQIHSRNKRFALESFEFAIDFKVNKNLCWNWWLLWRMWQMLWWLCI